MIYWYLKRIWNYPLSFLCDVFIYMTKKQIKYKNRTKMGKKTRKQLQKKGLHHKKT